MTLINLNSIPFYQLPVKVDLANKWSLEVSINDIPVICEERYTPTVSRSSNEWDEQIDNNDQIEVFDLAGPLSENPLNLFYKQAPNLKDTELYAKGNIHYF